MNDLPPEGVITFDSLCPLCKGPIRLYLPDDARNETTKMAIDAMIRMTAHEECVADRRRLERENRKAEVILARQEVWETMCPPEFMKPLDFGRPNCDQGLYERVMAWRFGTKGLILHGKTDRCKTRYMFKLAEREHYAGRKVVAITHPELRMQISALASDSQRDLARYLQHLAKVEILYIDDLGKGAFTPASEEALAELIDQRTKWNRPFLFTTNDDFRTLEKRLSEDRGKPLIRRLLQFCDDITV
jgi:hypothetical protein